MADITNPHDRFFKEILSREEAARDFILHYVPADIAALLDIDSLETRKDSFVDKDLKEHFSDLLCAVNLKGEGSAYVYTYMLREISTIRLKAILNKAFLKR